MSSVVIYIIIMIVLGLRSYLKSQAEKSQPIPRKPEDTDDEEYDEVHEQPEPEPEWYTKLSMTEDIARSNLYEEGSQRRQHSTQTEMAAKPPVTDHTIHPLYNGPEQQETEQAAFTPEDMKQALIYKTILDRPEY